jgi:sugar (pentulose or hexulose) kinase
MITLNTTATSADVFAGGGCAMGASVAPIGATGLSTWTSTAAVVVTPRERVTAERLLAPAYLPQHFSTTLGIHPSGRPQS